MFQLKSRFSSVVIISALITLPFLLIIPFIPNAHAGNVNELIQALNEPCEACNSDAAQRRKIRQPQYTEFFPSSQFLPLTVDAWKVFLDKLWKGEII